MSFKLYLIPMNRMTIVKMCAYRYYYNYVVGIDETTLKLDSLRLLINAIKRVNFPYTFTFKEKILFMAFQYALPRQTYVVSVVSEMLLLYSAVLGLDFKQAVVNDILKNQLDLSDIDKPVWLCLAHKFKENIDTYQGYVKSDCDRECDFCDKQVVF